MLLCFGRSTLRIIPTEVTREFAAVIRIDLCVVLTTRDRHVRKTIINQQFAFVCVDVNQNSVCCLPLAAMAGDGVSVVEMRMLADVKSKLTVGVHSDSKVAVRVDLFDRAEFTVRNPQVS